jgi:lipopolysaccharide export system ATP-binding protein
VGISVEVNQGERNRWFGPNGAGKQLPLYDCWLVKPNSGNIYLDDLNITDYPMYKSTAGVGYLLSGALCF